ncbi:MAG: hypothetical protein Ct9H300mP16_14710 [Pseudomonadota bacterium]|nr:MAG: hypothetical protein Ct9H300mP16_14710 [Pseudomonadota bacterium]
MELGLLLESLGESSKALQCYRRGLQQNQSPSVAARSESSPELLPAVIEVREDDFGSSPVQCSMTSAPNSKES